MLTEIPLHVARLPKLHTLQLENNLIQIISDAIIEATALTGVCVCVCVHVCLCVCVRL